MARLKGLGKIVRRTWLEIAIDNYLGNVEDKGQEPGMIHASWLTGTEEEIYQRLISTEPGRPPGPQLRRKFDDGIDTQRRYIRYFDAMGILYKPEGWDEDRGILYTDETYGIMGGVDCEIFVPEGFRVPVELKAYNSQLFQKYRHYARVDHVHQLQMYIYLTGAPYGYLLPECKDDQSIKPWKILRDDKLIYNALLKATAVWNRVIGEATNNGKTAESGISGLYDQLRKNLDAVD